MKTVRDNLREMANEVSRLVEDLLTNHSSIQRWNYPGSMIIDSTGDHAWGSLSEVGRQVQSRALEEYRQFMAILRVLLRGQPTSTASKLSETHLTVQRAIEQDRHTWSKTTHEVLEVTLTALDAQLRMVNYLFDPSGGVATYVPDTNALLYNNALDQWTFVDSPTFTILLTPTVLSELDALKINHRVETVRAKAEKLIRQVKEYRRRGRLTEGVPLRGSTMLAAIATEPKMEHSLNWLDPHSNDDRLLATIIEVMRQRPRSPVILVTADINLQNKAEFARIPFVEPPEPVKQ
jgi:hypothetical protein